MFILIFIYVCYILGAIKDNGELQSIGDVDNIDKTCVYSVANKRIAEGAESYGTLLTIVNSGNSLYNRTQFFVEASAGGWWQRTKEGSNWLSWSKNHNIPDFYQNYATLSSLANALGVITGTPALTTTPTTYNVSAGSWVFLSYEYQNEYVMGFCGRTGFLRISGDLQEHLGITISFDYSSGVLTMTAPSGMYGCNLAILK